MFFGTPIPHPLRVAIEVADVFQYEGQVPFQGDDNSAGGSRFFVGFIIAQGMEERILCRPDHQGQVHRFPETT
jgi:hypothetical protein